MLACQECDRQPRRAPADWPRGQWSGSRALQAYRLYHVAEGGRLRLGDAFQAADDALAIEKARVLRLSGSAAELWQEGRIVGRFSKSGGYAPAR